jgi:hypothetical protein
VAPLGAILVSIQSDPGHSPARTVASRQFSNPYLAGLIVTLGGALAKAQTS